MILKIGKYYGDDESLNKDYRYQIKENLDPNYDNITSVKNWFEMEKLLGLDYIYCRENAISYINNVGGFSGLTSEKDKIIACYNFCVPKIYRDTIFSDEVQFNNWSNLVIKSKKVRLSRWEKAKIYTSYLLDTQDSIDLAIITKSISENYIEYNTSELIDWLNSSDFSSKTYYSQELKDGIINRLNGNV